MSFNQKNYINEYKKQNYSTFKVDLKKEEKEESSTSETKEKKEGLDSILDAISGFDVDKISDGLNGMKKILNVLSEVTRPEETPPLSRRKMSKPYQRNDD